MREGSRGRVNTSGAGRVWGANAKGDVIRLRARNVVVVLVFALAALCVLLTILLEDTLPCLIGTLVILSGHTCLLVRQRRIVQALFLALATLVVLAMLVRYLGGCQSAFEPKVDDEPVMAEKAKAALVALARDDPWVLHANAKRLEAIRVVKGDEPHTYDLAWITINVEERWYRFWRGGDYSAWEYRGTFTVDADGRWTAQDPQVWSHMWGSPIKE